MNKKINNIRKNTFNLIGKIKVKIDCQSMSKPKINKQIILKTGLLFLYILNIYLTPLYFINV